MAKTSGRDRTRERMWRQVIREHARSGMSIRAFCRQSDLAESAFYFWRRELQRRQEQHKPGRSRRAGQTPGQAGARAFVPVRLAEGDASASPGIETARPSGMNTHGIEIPRPSDPPASGIEIRLSGGVRIHLATPVDRQALADVLSVLAAESVEQAAHGGILEGRAC